MNNKNEKRFKDRMEGMEMVFNPEDRQRVRVDDAIKLREKLGRMQINSAIFTTIIDSIKENGFIYKLNKREISNEEDLLLDFEVVEE
ncbi:MAG: hypothetical protein ACOC56_06300 [Atribacterota bacterium]